ncbi:MAG: hypothetical protein ACOYU4_11990 [Thermodesulfobacteriota bacterium]
MSMTPDEAEYEEFMDRLYEEHKEQAIEEFTAELLQSYYSDHKLLAKPAFDALIEARNLMDTSITAALVFSAVAMEVALKDTLLKPIVYGLVHAASVASLVTDLVMGHRSMSRYKDLLLQILREQGGVDLLSYKRPDSSNSIWDEVKKVQTKRNLILHTAQMASKEEAALALSVASTIMETLFPSVVTRMGLHLHDGYRICDEWKCKYEGTPMEKILKAT